MCVPEPPTRPILVIDVRGLPPDARTLETLARLQEHCDSLKAEGRVAMPERELARPVEPPDST